MGQGNKNPFENVSMSKPFGDSFVGGAGQVVKKGFQATTPFINYDAQNGGNLLVQPFDKTLQRPVGGDLGKGMEKAQNPIVTSEGKDPVTGEQVVEKTLSVDNGGFGGGVPQVKQYTAPQTLQHNPFAPPVIPTAGRSSKALEERLRSNARQGLKPNVEFGFNLQSNPNKRGI